jgi:hypothetical protein
MLSSSSIGRVSAGLNLTDAQRGHWRRIQSICGSQFGQSCLVEVIFHPSQLDWKVLYAMEPA